MNLGNNEAHRLQSIIERLEHCDAEKARINEDVADIKKEAKSAGYDVPAIVAIIKKRKQDAAKREAIDAMMEVYERALGQLADTPLGKAAMRSADFE